MKLGVIDVGGGFRDIYGAGVFDWCLDHGVNFDYCIGISAGSANLASIWRSSADGIIPSIWIMCSARNTRA